MWRGRSSGRLHPGPRYHAHWIFGGISEHFRHSIGPHRPLPRANRPARYGTTISYVVCTISADIISRKQRGNNTATDDQQLCVESGSASTPDNYVIRVIHLPLLRDMCFAAPRDAAQMEYDRVEPDRHVYKANTHDSLTPHAKQRTAERTLLYPPTRLP